MAIPPTYILTSPELLNDDLLGSELVDDFPNDLRSVEGRIADHRTATLARNKQNLGEDEFVPGLSVTAIDTDPIAFADTKLMAAVLDYRVHPSRLLAGAVFNDPTRPRPPFPSTCPDGQSCHPLFLVVVPDHRVHFITMLIVDSRKEKSREP